jgi:23S rRNA (cytosine1962-C5)-methyltransferase
VLKLYTAAWLPRLEEISRLIQEQTQAERVVLRLSRNIQERAKERYSRENGTVILGGPLGGPVIFLETGLRFEADALRGQKTGFFLDQRENRRRIETLAQWRDVLNAFSFSGGFSLYAARGGARSVTDLDISPHALSAAKRNFELNQSIPAVAGCRYEQVQGNAFEWLTAGQRTRFGLIILDPPSLAKREAERATALRAYGRLASSALDHLAPGGVLLACSCSAHVTSDEFLGAVRQSVSRTGTKFKELETTFHGPDHPATFREAQYLRAIYLRV